MHTTDPPNSASGEKHAQSIFSWVWRSNARMALLPLVIVELLLVGVYLISNVVSTQANIEAVQQLAEGELNRVAGDQAILIDRQLRSIRQDTEVFRRQLKMAYQNPYTPPEAERSRYQYHESGAWYTKHALEGASALFYSGHVEVGAAQREKAFQLAQIDPLMQHLKEANPLMVQLYFNTRDSMNRIYPYFDVIDQYPVKMEIPSYNFYYEADAKHNPKREVVWTDVYVDPAGQGWMSSAIAPVYVEERLEAVVGLDITVEAFVKQTLAMKIPWGAYTMLLDRSGTILALPKEGEADWKVQELTAHTYAEAITKDTFKPDAFNVFKREDSKALAEQLRGTPRGQIRLDLGGDRRVAWSTIPETGWTLLVVVPEANIHAQANALGATFYKAGLAMLLGLIMFYALFLAVLYRRTRSVSARMSEPLVALGEMVEQIGAGHYAQDAPQFAIEELNITGRRLADMGARLGANNRELLRLRDKALEASRLKSEFMASVSHELRTPMNGVIGLAELLLEEDLGANEADMVQTIRDSGMSLTRIIDDILDFSQIETGRLELHESVFEPEPWLHSIIELFTPRATSKGLPLLTHSAPLPSHLRGDPDRLRQVLVNLIGNAVKFTEEGSIQVRVEVDAANKETLWLKVSVEDTGIGIPKEAHAFLFMPFTQVDGSSTRSAGGVGLGLSISNQLIDAMGGEIGVESVVGEGSRFWFKVPLGVVEEHEVRDEPLSDLQGTTALVVGGPWSPRDKLTAILKGWNVTLWEADGQRNAHTTLKALEHGRKPPAVMILCDPLADGTINALAQLGTDTLGDGAVFLFGPGGEEPPPGTKRINGDAVAELHGVIRDRAQVLASTARADTPLMAAAHTHDSKQRILIVDDKPLNLQLLERALARNYIVDRADSGEAALKMAQEVSYDLILTDIHMPGMDGIEVTRRLRRLQADHQTPRTPMLAVTADVTEGAEERFINAGLDGYITKPFTLGHLRGTVNRWLS